MKKLILSKLIGSNIATRKSITAIKERIPRRNNLIVLDFSRVDFISRSFADELLRLKKEVEKSEKILEFQNLNPEIKKMLKIVEKQHQENTASPEVKLPKPKPLTEQAAVGC